MTEKPKAVVMPEDRICTCGHEQSLHTDEGRCDAIYCKGCGEFKQDFSRIDEGRKIYFAKELDAWLEEQAKEADGVANWLLRSFYDLHKDKLGDADSALFMIVIGRTREVVAALRGGK